MATARVGVVTSPSGAAICLELSSNKNVPCSDVQLSFDESGGMVKQAVVHGDFQKLDDLFSRWSAGHDRLPRGRWKLAWYRFGFEEALKDRSQWDYALAMIQRWGRERPNSFAARYTEALYWYEYAWEARGSGYADTVPKEAWDVFGKRLQKSYVALRQIAKERTKSPAWYSLMIDIMISGNAPLAETRKVFEDGVRLFPQYHELYFAMARAYQPQWGGSVEAYEKFANEAALKTRDFEGDGMYARIYWLVDGCRCFIPFEPKQSPYPNWAKLKTGYEDLMRHYPHSMYNLNRFAAMACRANDGVLYRRLRAQVGIYADDDVFSPVKVETCDQRFHWQPN